MFSNNYTPELRMMIANQDWKDTAFTIEKAFVCCNLSSLAYENIPEWELRNNSRIKIIPCGAYQEIIRNGVVPDNNALFLSNESGQYFVVNRRYACVTVLVTRNVVFVAIRGTQAAYDWCINFNARKVKIGWHREIYHRGFYKAMLACLDEVTSEIRKRANYKEIPVVVTGHSLGGAMAAIFRRFYDSEYYYRSHRFSPAYTFGMPRYGNMSAVSISSPYHIYNELDIVPTVPPRAMGFENCANEYRLDGVFIENANRADNAHFYHWIWNLATLKSIRQHFMEVYLERIRMLLP
jgi:hypothetical protein